MRLSLLAAPLVALAATGWRSVLMFPEVSRCLPIRWLSTW